MRCLICLEDINENEFVPQNCNCKTKYHKECFEYFLKNSKFLCPICKIEKNIIDKSFFNLVFFLPTHYALIIWFISSFLISFFIIPFIFIFEICGKIPFIVSYLTVLYLTLDTIIFYPMIFTQIIMLILRFKNISILI